MTPAHDETTNADGAEGRLAAAKVQMLDRAGAARDAAATALDKARDAAADAYSTTRDKAADLYVATRDKANDAYAAARTRAGELGQQAAEGVDANPMAVMIGGVALGALIGVLAPRSKREADLMQPLGTRVAGLAGEALAAAKGAGQDKLAELGLTREAAKAKFAELVDAGKEVAASASTAAAGTVRKGE